MNLDAMPSKHIVELEQKVHQLLLTMRKAKLSSEPLYTSLQGLEQELGENRRTRFDKDNPEYNGY